MTDRPPVLPERDAAPAPGVLYEDTLPPAGYATYLAIDATGVLAFRVTLPRTAATPERLELLERVMLDIVFGHEPLRIVR